MGSLSAGVCNDPAQRPPPPTCFSLLPRQGKHGLCSQDTGVGVVRTAADMINWPNNAFHVVKTVLPALPEFAGTPGDQLLEEAGGLVSNLW